MRFGKLVEVSREPELMSDAVKGSLLAIMEASSSAPAVAKRGRGRPRKTPRIVAEPPTTSPGSLDAAQDDATEESTSRDNSARTESPIAAAVAVESDGVSTSGMAMDVEGKSTLRHL